MKKVLVVILNYKTYNMTIDLILQLERLDKDLFDIMIIDNCSPNESSTVLQKYSNDNNVFFYNNDSNSGYAAGNNIGLRYAIEKGYQYSLILNNDLKIIDNQFIEKLVAVGDKDKTVACIGPKIIDLDGNCVAPYCNRPTFKSLTVGLKKEKELRERYINQSREVYRLFGCCMLVRNDAMRKVDCMDESTFLYCEEEILAERLLAFDLKSFYCAEASIIHMESSTVKKEGSRFSVKRFKPIFDSLEIYLGKYRKFNGIQIKICQLVRLLVILKRG